MKKYVIVDIDGTIAHNPIRQAKILQKLEITPIEEMPWAELFEDCLMDTPIWPVIDLMLAIADKYHVVFCTSRDIDFRDKTRIWIDTYTGLICAPLLMRKSINDYRSDSIIKPELLVRAGITINNTAFILEDKNSMVATWRELGFTVLQPINNEY
ncbi:hypothetical protein LCGC14_0278180 [marine sediment metagenome]|uniref:Polynucleotide kinase PNKP phosphatase domain-containing protein n=1 Tax=marine sediment metagenome TaxID=412755 RepID=A0A0F9TWT7_9ZZZZ